MPQFVSQLGQAQLILNASEPVADRGGNYSRVHVEMFLNCGNGASFTGNPVSWNLNIEGIQFSGTFTFDFRRTTSVFVGAADVNITHNSDGRRTINTSGSVGPNGTSAVGSGSTGGNWALTNLVPLPPTNLRLAFASSDTIRVDWNGPSGGSRPDRTISQFSPNPNYASVAQHDVYGENDTWTGLTPNTTYYFRILSQNSSGNSEWVNGSFRTNIGVPGTPTNVFASKITPTSFQLDWVKASNNQGQDPKRYEVQYGTSSSFTGASTLLVNSAATTATLTNLPPGTQTYVRVRAGNDAGWGPYSPQGGQTTLPSTSPTLTVLPAVSGKSATVSMTSPSGVSGVDRWLVFVTDKTTGLTSSYGSTASTYSVTGLTPGRQYGFQASAIIGTYTSPRSAENLLTMPAPSTGTGTYFDGSKTGTADQSYGWTGTPDNSTSFLRGKGVTGWEGVALGDGAVSLSRATGGIDDQFYGQMLALADLSNEPQSFRVGQKSNPTSWSPIEESTPYNASMFVNVVRDLPIMITIIWFDINGNLISTSYGTPKIVKASDDWVRVDATLRSPARAARAAIGIQDAAGNGTTERYIWDDVPNDSWSMAYSEGSTANSRTNYIRNPSSEGSTRAFWGFLGSGETYVTLGDDGTLGRAHLAQFISTADQGYRGVRIGDDTKRPAAAPGTRWWGRAKVKLSDAIFGYRKFSAMVAFRNSQGAQLDTTPALISQSDTDNVTHRWIGQPYYSKSERILPTGQRIVNHAQNPNFGAEAGAWGYVLESDIRYLIQKDGSARITSSTGSGQSFVIRAEPAKNYTLVLMAKTYLGSSFQIAGLQGQSYQANLENVTEWTELRFNVTTTATQNGFIFLGNIGGKAGAGFQLKQITLVEGWDYRGPAFDGTTPDEGWTQSDQQTIEFIPEGVFFRWQGLAHNSPSERYEGRTRRVNLASDPMGLRQNITPNTLGYETRWFGGGESAGTSIIQRSRMDGPVGLEAYQEKTWTVVRPDGKSYDVGWTHSYGAGAGYPVTPWETISISTMVRASRTQPADAQGRNQNGMFVSWHRADGTLLDNSFGGVQPVLQAGVWTEYKGTFVVPSGAAFASFVTMVYLDDCRVGDKLAQGALIVEDGPTAGPFFHGGYTGLKSGVLHRWRGSANASISERITDNDKVLINYHPNPKAANDTFGYGTANEAALTRVTTSKLGTTAVRTTFTGSSISDSGLHFSAGFNVPEGLWWTSLTIVSPTAMKLKFSPQGGAFDPVYTTVEFDLEAGVAKRVQFPFRSNGAFQATYILRREPGLLGYFDVRDIVISKEPNVQFDGSTPSTAVLATGKANDLVEFIVAADAPASGVATADLVIWRDSVSTNLSTDAFAFDEILLSQDDRSTPPPYFYGNQNWQRTLSGDTVSVDAAQLMLRGLISYFDGSTPDRPDARFDWVGPVNASISTMTRLDVAASNPLADPDVPAIPSAPRPPVLVDEGIIEVGTWRRYWVVIPADEISAFLSQVPTTTIRTGAVPARQVRIRIYPNPDNVQPSEFDDSTWVSEQIVSFIPANTVMMLDGVEERVWASVAGGPSVGADHLLYGTGGVPATWPVLSCGTGYLLSFDAPLESPSNNITVSVDLTRRA
jgi:hypothetical protein